MASDHIRLRAERKLRRARVRGINKRQKALATREKEHLERISKINRWLKEHPERPPLPGIEGGWMRGVARTQTGHGFSYRLDGGNKMVWHTTEGTSIPNYQLGWPHFTLDIKRNRLEQHIPITQAAQTLRNPAGGADTNAVKHTIQCEIVGFARDAANWTDAEYRQIADLARWVEHHVGVPRTCGVTFRTSSNHKIQDWTGYKGHCGHQHVPENDHWDPGLLNIRKVLA